MRSPRLFYRLLALYAVLSGAIAVLICALIAYQLAGQREVVAREKLRTTAEALRILTLGTIFSGESAFSGGSAPSGESSSAASSSEMQLQQFVDQLARENQQEIVILSNTEQILADSAHNQRDRTNLRSRPEVQQALRSRVVAYDVRIDSQSGRRATYLALPILQAGQPVAIVRASSYLPSLAITSAPNLSIWLAAAMAWSVALAVVYFALSRMIAPLERLTRSAQAIAAGDDLAALHWDLPDELALLSAAINEMRENRAHRLNELREKSELLVSVLGNMVEGVIAVAPDETVLIANEASSRLLGFSAETASQRPLLEVTRCRPLHEAVVQSLVTNRPVNLEFEAPGTPRRTLAVRSAPLAREARAGVLIVMHDVTELRRLENLRREFVANVSHELKTPLASVKAYAETLRLGAIDDTEHRLAFVGRIEEQAERLHQLIVDLLHLARVESGQQAFDIGPVSLGAIAEACSSEYGDAAISKGTTLRLDSNETVIVLADEEGLRTIINNLIDNAIKYTPPGGEVAIAWRAEDHYATLSVRDTGIGIAPRDQARVFERFFRVDKARSRELGGTGLGLSIVKHLAQAFGGDVRLESQLGSGSIFHVRLPRAPVSSHTISALRVAP